VADIAPINIADLAAEYRELGPELEPAVLRVLASGRYILGSEGAALERSIAEYVGAPHAVAMNSGTDALHLALRAAGIGAGDEVVVPAFTFVATAEAVSYTGATPVFADVDERTFCLDPRSLEEKLSSRTRAVIPVHLYGQTAPLGPIGAICRDRGLVMVEDCAQSLGADEGGRGAGSIGDFGCFSFYPTKNLAAAGDAGLVTTPEAAMDERLRMLRHHGSRKTYVHEFLGYNSRLDEIQAVVLRIKLAHLERYTARRAEVAQLYRRLLADAPVRLPEEHGRGRHVWHQFTIRSERRDAIRAALEQAKIGSGIYYPTPLHQTPLYADANQGLRLPVSEVLSRTVLSLPIHPFLADADVERVAETIRSAA